MSHNEPFPFYIHQPPLPVLVAGKVSPLANPIPTTDTPWFGDGHGLLRAHYSPLNPWAKPPLVDPCSRLLFFRLPPASSPEAYSSSSSASSYSRSNFFPSGLRLEMTVICFFFLFTFHTQPSRPTMGPETARIFFPGRKTTRETPR